MNMPTTLNSINSEEDRKNAILWLKENDPVRYCGSLVAYLCKLIYSGIDFALSFTPIFLFWVFCIGWSLVGQEKGLSLFQINGPYLNFGFIAVVGGTLFAIGMTKSRHQIFADSLISYALAMMQIQHGDMAAVGNRVEDRKQ